MKNSQIRTVGDRARDAVLILLTLAMVAQLVPSVFAAWDKTKPANNSALVSSEIRANWTSIESALGNPDNDLTLKNVASTSTFLFTTMPTGLGMPVLGRLTADATKNANTTFGDLTGLSFSVAANTTYTFEVRLKVIGNTTANAKFTFTGPAAPTAVIFGGISGITPTATNNTAENTFGNAVKLNLAGTNNTEMWLVIGGIVRNGANAGTVQTQYAQLTSDATNLTIRAESFLLATRMQ